MSTGAAAKFRILAVDDDHGTLVLYRHALTDSQSESSAAAPATDFEVTLCSQAEEAVEAAAEAVREERPFAVAFVDVNLPPGPDGVWAAEQIRHLDPNVQLVMVTAGSDTHPEEIASRVPPRDKIIYLRKPLHPLELQNCAASFASKWQSEREVAAARLQLESRVAQRTAELAQVNRALEEDINERRRVEEALRRSEAGLARAQKIAHLGSWDLDLDNGELNCSEEVFRVWGIPRTLRPLTVEALLKPVLEEDRELVEKWLERGIQGVEDPGIDHRIVLSDGGKRTVHERLVLGRDADGRPRELMGAIQDITELKRSEEQIAYQAFHDALTGLPNRLLFNDRLRVAIAHARRRAQGMAVLFLDLDHFKTINDSLGHAAGDELLQEVARRLVASVREEDTVARLGGDEFIILLQEAADPNYTVHVAERILESVAEPITVRGHELYISTSIGITLFPDDGDDAESLVANADIAMYRAKEHGRNAYKLFTPAMNERVMERMGVEISLRKGLKEEQLVVHYQPILAIDSQEIVALEALVRWQRPGIGLVHPNDFIPLAEETGLIVPLGAWVLRTACAAARSWQEKGFDQLRISVNLSPRQFHFGNVAALVAEVLEETGLPAASLILEITEGAVMRKVDDAISTMRALTDLGVKLSLDDFGRGYSSLSHLKDFPVSTLKIDRAFVGDLTTDPSDASIVRAIISMGRSLNLNVVAEGVETDEQLAFLKRYSCDFIQGFLMGRPIPKTEVEDLLNGGK